MFFKAAQWSLSIWHWQSQGKMPVYQAFFVLGKFMCNFENKDCRDLGVLEQLTNSSFHCEAMLRRAQLLSGPPLMPRTFQRSR